MTPLLRCAGPRPRDPQTLPVPPLPVAATGLSTPPPPSCPTMIAPPCVRLDHAARSSRRSRSLRRKRFGRLVPTRTMQSAQRRRVPPSIFTLSSTTRAPCHRHRRTRHRPHALSRRHCRPPPPQPTQRWRRCAPITLTMRQHALAPSRSEPRRYARRSPQQRLPRAVLMLASSPAASRWGSTRARLLLAVRALASLSSLRAPSTPWAVRAASP